MTSIEITDERIEIKGHSGYAAIGSDIVCAAISTLSQATYNYLEVTNNEVTCDVSDGELVISLHKLNEPGKQIVRAFRDMVDDLSSQYPEYIERRK
jgi:uncharacterized protein YsxB (DUF464 family)